LILLKHAEYINKNSIRPAWDLGVMEWWSNGVMNEEELPTLQNQQPEFPIHK
jgi:hypothetical protein